MADVKTIGIRIVSPAQFSAGTRQTPGSQRMAAISAESGIDSRMWAGTFLVEPGASTGIHHHGDQETIAFVLEGEALVRWGERGEQTETVRAGDFLHVPAWLVHQERNVSPDAPFRWVVVRSSPEPIVVNLPDSAWD
ncbi:MAG: hypothetical protein NVSMB62_07880 [Acidobacteriaceae bacterium]